jgi:hypothetical protein
MRNSRRGWMNKWKLEGRFRPVDEICFRCVADKCARACICFVVAFLSRFLPSLVSSDSASAMAARAFCSRIRTRISAYFMVQTLHLSFIPLSVEQTEKKVERIFFRLSMMTMMRRFSFFTFVFSSVCGVKCKDGWFFLLQSMRCWGDGNRLR